MRTVGGPAGKARRKGQSVHRIQKLPLVAFALVALLGSARSAAAQPIATGLALDRFDPAERGSEWFALDSLDLRGRVRPAVGVDLDWGHKPLVLYDAGGREVGSVVSDQLFVHAGASLVLFDRVRVGFNLPIAIVQSGDGATLAGITYPAPGAPQIGDLRLGADVRVVGRYGSPFTLAAGANLYLPTGSRDDYTSDGVVRAVIPHVNASGEIGAFVYAAKLGFELRRSQIVGGERLGDDFQFGVAAGARLARDRLVLGPELYGSTVVEGGAFRTAGTPLELIFGVHYQFASDWRAGAGFGPGIVRGDGAPLFRALASIEWAPAYRDADHHGGNQRRDDSRYEDADHDGIADAYDACPDKPGRRSSDPRRNGCPRVRVEERQIKITEEIKFKTDSAELLPESDGVLFEVRDTLNAHPEIRRVRVEGHTDNVGDPQYNRELSQRRAEAVAAWLVEHGVDRGRLQSAGVGEARPLDTNATEAGRHNNRRVEFHIVDGR
jgi:outer membrane protein OmpA-like peptidoglycan-associated protein